MGLCLVGCWIIYKVFENQMHELVAYELMSANDASERDPMDWYDFLEHNHGFTYLSISKLAGDSLLSSSCGLIEIYLFCEA